MPALRSIARRLWRSYHRHYTLVLTVTTAVLLLQVFHLYWLFTGVVMEKLTGRSFFLFPDAGMFIYILADYLEIPALISASLLYVYEFRRRPSVRSLLLLGLVNTQWAHLFWITDAVAVEALGHQSLVAWPALVAWLAIAIDYLEAPVIADTLLKAYGQRRLILAAVTALLP